MVGTWIKLATATASGSSKTLSSGTFTTKKYLRVEAYGDVASGNMDNIGWRFNEDVNSNYTYDSSIDYDSGNNSSGTYIRLGGGSATGGSLFVSTVIANKSSNVKICTSECCKSTGTGSSSNGNNVASTNLHSFQTKGKWNNSSDNITSIQLKHEGTANWSTNSTITVWGASEDTVSDEKTTLADATVTTTATPTVDDNPFTSNLGWLGDGDGDWDYNASNYLDFSPIRRQTTAQVMYIDMQDADYLGSGNNLSDTKWVIRLGKWTTVSQTSSTANVDVFIGVSTNGSGGATTSQEAVIWSLNGNSGDAGMVGYACEGSMVSSRSNTTVFTADNDVGDKWLEIIRDGDVFTFNLYSDEYVTKTEGHSVTRSGIAGLRYFKIANDNESSNSQTWNAKLYGLEIYNGITEVSSTSSAAPPANTRYEETDTRKIYRKVDPTTPTYTPDMTSDTNWLDTVSARIDNNTSTGKIDFDVHRTDTNQALSYDLGTALSNTAWTLRYKMTVDTITQVSDANRMFMGMRSISASSNASTNSDFIGWHSKVGRTGGGVDFKEFHYMTTDGSSMDIEGTTSSVVPTTTTYYITITRKTATTWSLRISTSADYTGGTLHDDISCASGTQGLQYLWIGNVGVSGGSSARFIGTIEDVKIYNGSASFDEWKERGTA